MFFLYKERTKEIPNQYNHRTGQLPSLRQLPGFGLCMDVSGVECRAASPLATARGVLPCGANLFLKEAIGGKKCEYPHKLEFAPSVKLNLPLIKFQRFLVGYLFQSFVQMQVPISQNYMIWM